MLDLYIQAFGILWDFEPYRMNNDDILNGKTVLLTLTLAFTQRGQATDCEPKASVGFMHSSTLHERLLRLFGFRSPYITVDTKNPIFAGSKATFDKR